MRIVSIDKNSIAEELGFESGDVLHSINGRRVQDVIDYRYLISDECVEVEVERDSERTIFEIEKEADDTLGLNLEPIKVRMCGNDCPFCFVDQNPAGMRQSLYFRDEDFRLSFLSGHYVTLTNISRRDLQRIIDQRLSPLFISVHAVNPEVRKFLLGLRHDDRLLEKLDFLTKHGIDLHTQIVVCPTHNDGAILEETLHALSGYFPHIRSVALVPLGLTKHREGLTRLVAITNDYAKNLIAICDCYAESFKKKLGIYFVYPSDEFYIMAGLPIPPRDRYDTFDQLENGVGMVRSLLNDFQALQPELLQKIDSPAKITLVTGDLMGEILQKEIIDVLSRIGNLTASLIVVKNDFYGETIRISGLLTGQDIFKNLANYELGDLVFLPKNCVNDDRVFLDDWTVVGLQNKLGTPVKVISNDFSEIFNYL